LQGIVAFAEKFYAPDPKVTGPFLAAMRMCSDRFKAVELRKRWYISRIYLGTLLYRDDSPST